MRPLFGTLRLSTLLIAAAVLVGAASLVRYTSGTETVALDVPFVVTPHMAVDHMLVMANVGPEDFVIDLGSGDGRIVIAAARDYGAHALGVDIDPARIAESREAAREAGVEDLVSFRQENLFDTDISDATVVTMYLLSSVNLRLRPRLLEELRPGTRVVSHSFQMGAWQADETAKIAGSNLYMWIIPANVEGRWRLTGLGKEMDISFEQTYQEIEGAVWRGQRAVPLTRASLRGKEIHLVIETEEGSIIFEGRVTDGAIVPADEDETWSLVRQ